MDGPDPVPMNHSPFFGPAIEPPLSTGVNAAISALPSRLAA
ncbi:hypothetical protein [Arthrobacter sp.]